MLLYELILNMDTIVFPENMPNTALVHIEKALGESTSLEGRRLRQIEAFDGNTYQLMGLRSGDIPIWVTGTAQLGLCGSDWVAERLLQYKLDLVVLDSYRYGRQFYTQPKNELVVPQDVVAETTSDLEANVTVGEYEYTMRDHFQKNWSGRVTKFGDDPQITDLTDYRKVCIEKGEMGIVIAHGGIPELVRRFGVYGFMVSETNGTKTENGIKVVSVVHEIHTQLITTKEALLENEESIMAIQRKMQEAYNLNYKEKPMTSGERAH